jgi:hypothetical protein
MSSRTYRISGTDLWCPDAERATVWLEYCPQPSQIFFTHHNRDPKIYTETRDIVRSSLYNLWQLVGYTFEATDTFDADTCYELKNGSYYKTKDTTQSVSKTYYIIKDTIDVKDSSVTQEQISNVEMWILKHRNISNTTINDISSSIIKDSDTDGKWELKFISCDYPYIFCSYQHNVTGEWHSGFFNKSMEWTDYNPFEWVGRNDNVEYIECHYNDKTGLGVIVRDWNDLETKILNIDKLPYVAGTVIFVENTFEYKGEDGTVATFTPGYWYNRYNTDYNYEAVPEVEDDLPEDAETDDIYLYNGVLYKFNGSTWDKVTAIKYVAQKETKPRVKELGWTPDTKLVYPAPEVYRYLVARLAEKFSALNESNIMGVQSELVDARFAFQAFLKKDKSAWERMRNVNPATIGDWL